MYMYKEKEIDSFKQTEKVTEGLHSVRFAWRYKQFTKKDRYVFSIDRE